MAFCTNCGEPLNEGASFCTSCGAKINAAEAEKEQAVVDYTEAEENVVEETPVEAESEEVCQQAECACCNHQEEECQPKAQEPKGGVYGLGGAITAAILGFLGMIFSVVSEFFAVGALDSRKAKYHYGYYGGYYTYSYDEDLAIAAIVLGIIAIVMSIVGIVLGIRAICKFKKGKKLGRNPIGTLIVGIGGLSLGAMGIIFSLVGIFGASVCL